MFNSEQAQQKWGALLDHPDCTPIKDNYRRAVTATLLENQEKAMREERLQQSFLHEGNDTVTGDVGKFDPTLIALVRRAMPSLIAYDICGVIAYDICRRTTNVRANRSHFLNGAFVQVRPFRC